MKRSILTAFAIAVLSITIIAQPPQRKRGGERGQQRQEMFQKMAQELDLTEDQKNQIKGIRLKSMKSMKPIKNELGEKEARLKTLTSADKPDNKAIKALAQEIGNLRGNLFVIQVESRQEIRTLLTEEQKLKFDMQDRRQMRKKRI